MRVFEDKYWSKAQILGKNKRAIIEIVELNAKRKQMVMDLKKKPFFSNRQWWLVELVKVGS